MRDPHFDDADLSIADILRRWPETIPVIIGQDMLCFGCLVGLFQVIDDACAKSRGWCG